MISSDTPIYRQNCAFRISHISQNLLSLIHSSLTKPQKRGSLVVPLKLSFLSNFRRNLFYLSVIFNKYARNILREDSQIDFFPLRPPLPRTSVPKIPENRSFLLGGRTGLSRDVVLIFRVRDARPGPLG